MRREDRSRVHVVGASALRAGAAGAPDAAALIKDRRSRKVGMLPDKARMVLAAANRCLPAELIAAAAVRPAIGVSLGTLFGSMDMAETALETVRRAGFGQVVPSWYATGLANATGAIVASTYNFGGPNLCFLGHHAGIEAIVQAAEEIADGRAEGMLAGGFDMPSAAFAGQRDLWAGRGEPALHAGVGLLWLTGEAPAHPVARIAGWSRGFFSDAALSRDQIAELVDAAGGVSDARQIHVVGPGDETADYLAATAPIALVERIKLGGRPGRWALIAKGFGPPAVCVLIEIVAHAGSAANEGGD